MSEHQRSLAGGSGPGSPAVMLGFWIIKILATTLGETGGDSITMSWLGETTSEATGYGYLIGTGILAVPFVVLAAAQILAKKFHPFLYWATIAASTMLGTTLADFATRSLGIGYPGGSTLLFALVMLSLAGWYWSEGTVSVQTVSTPRVELWYWITITFSQTLGTALGDWAADSGLGYDGGALVFGVVLAAVAAAYYWTRLSHVLLFWAAFILTRPLGATIGDFLDKPVSKGGLEVSRPLATAVLAVVIIILDIPAAAACRNASQNRRELIGMHGAWALLGAAGVVLLAAPAFAGPPFVTDDPQPTDFGHYEIYAFTAGTATRGDIGGTAGIDFNYGAAPDLQLTAVIPFRVG